ncbi:MAG: hypothetical protein WCK59_04405 [Candidatus Falkowbacteria bacterium]
MEKLALFFGVIAMVIAIANFIYTFLSLKKIRKQLGASDFEMNRFKPFNF